VPVSPLSSSTRPAGTIEWLESGHDDVLMFRSGGVTVVANTGAAHVDMPAGRVLLESGETGTELLAGDTTVWLAN
jgi:alpha-glucosidase